MMGGYLEYPMSKGSLHISSKDPFSAPDFVAGYLTDEADMVGPFALSTPSVTELTNFISIP